METTKEFVVLSDQYSIRYSILFSGFGHGSTTAKTDDAFDRQATRHAWWPLVGFGCCCIVS